VGAPRGTRLIGRAEPDGERETSISWGDYCAKMPRRASSDGREVYLIATGPWNVIGPFFAMDALHACYVKWVPGGWPATEFRNEPLSIRYWRTPPTRAVGFAAGERDVRIGSRPWVVPRTGVASIRATHRPGGRGSPRPTVCGVARNHSPPPQGEDSAWSWASIVTTRFASLRKELADGGHRRGLLRLEGLRARFRRSSARPNVFGTWCACGIGVDIR
jgi:hypothetical protein